MNSKINLLLLLWSLFILTTWCATSKDNKITVESPILTIENTWTVSSWEADNYPSVDELDNSRFDKQRQQSEQRFYVNDIARKWNYRSNRNFFLIWNMGVHAVDIQYWYMSGYIYTENAWRTIIRFPVDFSFISFNPQLNNPYYIGTWILHVAEDKPSYKVCKDGFDMQKEEVVYNREKYEALLEKNPMRCFWEDKTYVYGRREYKKSEEGWYELMRIRK